MQKLKPKSKNKYIEPWVSIAAKFYRENKMMLFYDHLLQISRLFTKVLKKSYAMHLADEMFVSETIRHFIEKDIRNLNKIPDSTKKKNRNISKVSHTNE